MGTSKSFANAYYVSVFSCKGWDPVPLDWGVLKKVVAYTSSSFLLGVERERNQVFVRIRDILFLSLGYYYFNCRDNEHEDFFPVFLYLESESNSLKSIQRITNFPGFFLPDILYRLCRSRNLKDRNMISDHWYPVLAQILGSCSVQPLVFVIFPFHLLPQKFFVLFLYSSNVLQKFLLHQSFQQRFASLASHVKQTFVLAPPTHVIHLHLQILSYTANKIMEMSKHFLLIVTSCYCKPNCYSARVYFRPGCRISHHIIIP